MGLPALPVTGHLLSSLIRLPPCSLVNRKTILDDNHYQLTAKK
jgi:hypothetical protein